MKKIDWDSMNELSKIYQEGAASYEKQCSEFWEKLSYDDKLAAFYSVVSRLTQGELKVPRSYRGILYDIFGFGPDGYGIGMQCGFMELHNAIYMKDELEWWATRNGYVKEVKND